MRRVLVVDDHALVRKGIRQVLEEAPGRNVVVEAPDGEGALAAARSGEVDAVLLDLGLPDRPGLDVLQQLKLERPSLPVVILTMHGEEAFAVRALRLGASGYLTKGGAPEELLAALEKVTRGGRFVSEAVAERLADLVAHGTDRPPHELLSDREFQVFGLMAQGRSLTEIARALFVSVKTVSTHRARILQKLGLRNNAELVQYALRHGLVP